MKDQKNLTSEQQELIEKLQKFREYRDTTTGREIAEIQGDLEEIRDRLLEIYNELAEKDDPKTAGHVWGAHCQTKEALRCLWRGFVRDEA